MAKTILLIGNNPSFFEAPENVFQTRGCDIFGVMDGPGAVQFLSAHGADLVLTHGVPNDVSPTDLTEGLAGNGEIVLISGTGDDEAALDVYREMSTATVLDGPLKKGELLRLTSNMLGALDRKFISILVQVKVSKPKPTTVFGKSKDLSETGVLVECSQPLMLYDKVGFSFLIPGAENMIQGDALVARDDGGSGRARRYGLKFLTLTAVELAVIRDYLQGKLASKTPSVA